MSTDPPAIDSETYRIVTVCFDKEGNEILPAGVVPLCDTGRPYPTFGIVEPAVTTTRVDMSPYGLSYFDIEDSREFIKTATKVFSDNSALMRNIRRHENALEGAITDIARAVMCVSRGFGESIPEEGPVRVQYDDRASSRTPPPRRHKTWPVFGVLRMFAYGIRKSVPDVRRASRSSH